MKNANIGVYEFARRTGRDVTSLYKLIYANKIQGATKTGRKWLIPISEVEPWTRPKEQGK
jgi:excisionase family DNA binding protein